MNQKNPFKAGFVSLVGKPNVGKSTLINQLVGEKVSITANKPQTTRQLIRGIKTSKYSQIIFIDTPGIQDSKRVGDVLMNQRMNQSAKQSLNDVDLIAMMTDISEYFDDDEIEILNTIKSKQTKETDIPVLLIVNKSDMLKNEELMLNVLKKKSQAYPFKEIIPISAFNGTNLKRLVQLIEHDLPQSDLLYDENEVTDHPLFRRVEEMIREKCMRDLHQEIPFKIAIKVNHIDSENKLVRIQADIWVDSIAHKKIVIGAKGKMIQSIGTHARYNLETKLFKKKVYLELFVKVQKDWFNKTNLLNGFCI